MDRNYLAAGLFLLVVIFNVFILKPEVSSGHEQLQVPDISFFYSGEEIYENFFDRLTPEAIANHQIMLRWDFAYPIVYTAFFILMGYIVFPGKPLRTLFIGVALLIFMLDYSENFMQLYILSELPEPHLGKGDRLGYLSSAKWLMVGFEFTLLLVGGIIKIVARKQRLT
jgi:hypothetical protein